MAKNITGRSVLSNTGLVLLISYVLLFVVNAAVLIAFNSAFPTRVVLGTFSIDPLWAVIHSMGVLALINVFALPVVEEVEKRRGKKFSVKEWFTTYFGLNFIGLWLISRFSEQFGLGFSAWYVVAFVALVLDIVQGGVMMQLEKLRLRSV